MANILVENTNVTAGTAIPAGTTGCWVTLIGGGGGGGIGVRSSTNAYGAGGGGGGGKVDRVFIAVASLGSTYSVTRGSAGVGATTTPNDGTAGGASTFSSGSVSLSAGGGGAGIHGTGTGGGAAGAGGTCSASGVTATTHNGTASAAGTLTTGTDAADNLTGGAPGGGGGAGTNTTSNKVGGAGGDSATVAGAVGSNGGSASPGLPGAAAAAGNAGGGGAGGGAATANAAFNGHNGGDGGVYGAGGGGGGGRRTSSALTYGTGGDGAAGYTLVEWVIPNAKTDTLTDAFTTIGANWSASLYSTDSAKVTNPSGTVRIDHPTTSQYNALGTVDKYDLTGSSFYARVVDYGNQSLGSHEVLLFADDGSGANRLIWDASGNNLYAIKMVASSKTTLGGISLNTTTHRYLRIREASGTVYWDTSADGVAWTNRFSDTTPFNVSSVNVQMQCGNYATEASASYAVFDDFNCCPLVETLTDDFATKDTTKWNYFDVNADAVSGRLQITPTTGYPGIDTNGAAVPYYDLTGSSAFVEAAQLPNLGNGSTEMYFQLFKDSNNYVLFIWSGGSFTMRERAGGTNSDASLTYDPVAHRFWRIREASGTTYWDTSPDGSTWTNRRSKASGIDLTALRPALLAGYWGTEPSPGTAIFDNVNLVPASAPANTGQFFAMM